MKHLLTLLFITLALSGLNKAYTQALQITPSDTFSYNGILATSLDSHEQSGYFVNNTANGDSIYWRAVSSTMDSAWQMSFCDPLNCYYFTQTVGSYTPNRFWAAAGGSYQLRFGVSPSCSADSGKLVVVAWLANDSAASSKTLYYFANYTGSCATAVPNVTTSAIKIYPSPVTSNMTLTGLSAYDNIKVTLYDILGNVAIQKNISQPGDATSINTDMLHGGVYVLTIESQGSRLLIKRIEKMD